jgi:hypothetical protein
MNARTRTVRSTHSPRVRPHTRRRNGVVDAPGYPMPPSPHVIAVVLGWRPVGG